MKALLKTAIILTLSVLCFTAATAQKTRKEKKEAKMHALETMIDTANFTFEAERSYPQHGTTSDLSGGYTLKVSNNVLSCSLPYSGQAYISTMNQDDSGITFTADNFDYFVDKKEGFGWNVLMRPNAKTDVQMRDVKQIVMSVTLDGEATVQFTFASRERITFTSNIEKYTKD